VDNWAKSQVSSGETVDNRACGNVDIRSSA
jgi:hypothetical protein